MSLAITATPLPSAIPPQWQLDVTSAVGTVTITRRSADASVYAVRTANPADLISGAVTVYDPEPSHRLAGTYTVTDGSGTSASVNVPGLWEYGAQWPWLIHAGTPSLSVRIVVVSGGLGELTRPTRRGVHEIEGRADPIVISSGVRGAGTFDMVVRTVWDDAVPFGEMQEEDRLARILEDDSPLLFQQHYPDSQRFEYAWVSVGDWSRRRMVPILDSPWWEWTLPCTMVRAPSGTLRTPWSSDGLADRYDSSEAVAAAYASSDDVAIDHPIPAA